jgi:hypothetical protein
VGLRDRLLGLLNRGEPVGDPLELVEVARVQVHLGPLLVESMCDDGIEAVWWPAYNVLTRTLSDARIMAPRVHAPRAAEIIEFGRPELAEALNPAITESDEEPAVELD